MLTEHAQSTDGVSVPIHVLRAGDSALPPILLIHATGFHGSAYRVLAEALAKRTKASILAPDLRGHGDCPSPAGGRYSWDGFADDLAAVVEKVGHRNLIGFGHSMGGATLLSVEQRRPGTFACLNLFEPIVFPSTYRSNSEDSPLVEAARRRRSHFPSFEAAIERFGSRPPLDVLDSRCLRDYVKDGFEDVDDGIQLKLPGNEEAEVFRMSLEQDTWSRLGEVQSRSIVAFGESQSPGPSAVAPLIADRLPNGQRLEYSDLGHFGPLQAPERIASDLVLQAS